jgi:hypothetical protein
MDYNQFPGQGKGDTATSFISGAIFTFLHSFFKGGILQINFTDWSTNLLWKVVEVGIVATVGGAFGLIGKKLVEKYLFKKAK